MNFEGYAGYLSGGASGGGTVLSITAGTGLSATPNPITSSGTISLSSAVQTQLDAATLATTYLTANTTTNTTTVTAGTQLLLDTNATIHQELGGLNYLSELPILSSGTDALLCGPNAATGVLTSVGINNVVYGIDALPNLATGDHNTAMGMTVLAGVDGNDNVAFGASITSLNPLLQNAVGIGSTVQLEDDGVAIGAGAALSGVGSTALGTLAECQAANSVALGANTLSVLPDEVVLGDTSVDCVTSSTDQLCDLGRPAKRYKLAYVQDVVLPNYASLETSLDTNLPRTFATSSLALGDSVAVAATGTQVTSLGYQSSLNATTGFLNTAIGSRTLQTVTTEANNTAVGGDSQLGLGARSGSGNTSVGTNSMENIAGTTSNCTAIGYNCVSTPGFTNITSGTFIGYGCDVSATGLSRVTVIGAAGIVKSDDQIALGEGAVCTAGTPGQCMIGNANLTQVVPQTAASLGTTAKPWGNLQCTSINNLRPSQGKWMATSTGTNINNTVLELDVCQFGTVVGTQTFSANELDVSQWNLRISGSYSALAASTLTLRVYFGAIVLLTQIHTNAAVATGKFFELNADLGVQAIGAAGVAKINGALNFRNTTDGNTWSGVNKSVTNATTVDSTIANIFTVTVQWSAASASNAIQRQAGSLTKIY